MIATPPEYSSLSCVFPCGSGNSRWACESCAFCSRVAKTALPPITIPALVPCNFAPKGISGRKTVSIDGPSFCISSRKSDVEETMLKVIWEEPTFTLRNLIASHDDGRCGAKVRRFALASISKPSNPWTKEEKNDDEDQVCSGTDSTSS